MSAAPHSQPDPVTTGTLSIVTPGPGASAAAGMDREFIVRNQIIERYLGGKLPLKGAQDFERYCREHPELLDEIGLTERINAALRLLDAGGRATPWEERPRRLWEQLPAFLAVCALALACAITALVLLRQLSTRDHAIGQLKSRLAAAPLDPAQSTRTVTILPSRTAPTRTSAVTIGGGQAQMADLRFDVSWSPFTAFRVTIDRVDQGRVAVLHNVLKDSLGTLHIAFNSSALGPGDYQFTLEGLNWRGEPVAQAWATVGVAH
jgi:ferric-dicitrate binding protein FerR (iron transport regulator)